MRVFRALPQRVGSEGMMKENFRELSADEVIEALDGPGPVLDEVERLMQQYSQAIAAGCDPYDIIIPTLDTPAIEAVAMHLMHEALALAESSAPPLQ